MLNIIIENKKRIISAAVLLAMALVSFFGLGAVATSPETYEKTMESLDQKKNDVLALTASAAAASTAVSFLPGDAGSSIADKLADLTTGLAIILCIIYLEKYMLTVLGYAAFKIIIPIALAMIAVTVFAANYKMRQMAVKLIVFALIITFVVPAGETVSGIIQSTYQETMDKTIADAQKSVEEMEEGNEKAAEEEEGFFAGIISKVTDAVTGFVTSQLEKAKNTMSNLIEATAVMVVTSCIIPVLVLLFAFWVLKMLFGIDIPINTAALRSGIKKAVPRKHQISKE